MSLSYNFLQNKNNPSILLGILLIGYLYLDTPLPFNLVLEKMSLLVTILLAVFVTCYLCINLNVYVAIIFLIVAYEVIRKSMKQNPKNINKKVRFYGNSQSNSTVISEKLKESNTLEQEMVSKMVPTIKRDEPNPTPRYQALLPDLTGTAPIDYDGML